MNGARTVREALLVQAFGELDLLLAKTAAVEQSLSIGTLRLEAAAARGLMDLAVVNSTRMPTRPPAGPTTA